ncbi:hypothetical protein, partial [Sutterella seckii]|uniref:hypothetical protein n=1 Tax=Sutterella seckii TaxID=1944635 RepID=UPI00186A58D5
ERGAAAPAPAGGHKRRDGALCFVKLEIQLLLSIIPGKSKICKLLLTPVLFCRLGTFRAECLKVNDAAKPKGDVVSGGLEFFHGS